VLENSLDEERVTGRIDELGDVALSHRHARIRSAAEHSLKGQVAEKQTGVLVYEQTFADGGAQSPKGALAVKETASTLVARSERIKEGKLAKRNRGLKVHGVCTGRRRRNNRSSHTS